MTQLRRVRPLRGAFFGIAAAISCFAACAAAGAPASEESSLHAMRARIESAQARIGAQTALYHDPVGPRTWIDGSRLWYCETTRHGARQWWLADASKEGDAARIPLFDHVAAAAALAGDGRAAPAPDQLSVRAVAVEGARVIVSLEGRETPLVFDLSGGPPRAGDPADRGAFELRLSAQRARSRGQGASTALDFVNRLEVPVEMFWIDARGEERSYGVVAPGATRGQHTYGGHAWLVRTSSGDVLGTVVAADVRKSVIIERVSREPEPVDLLDGQKEVAGDGARGASNQATDGVGGRSAQELPSYEVARDGASLVLRREGREFFRTPAGEVFDAHWISPGRDAVLAMQVVRAEPRRVTIVESSPKDQLQPKVRSLGYTKPGDAIDVAVPRLVR
ncbi:MAG: hypothetical protein ACKO3W_01255, partial [bacterium]